jgi:hypothetical protein
MSGGTLHHEIRWNVGFAVPALPMRGFRIPVGQEALRQDRMDISDAVRGEWVLGAFLEAIEALAVNGAQLEDVVHVESSAWL